MVPWESIGREKFNRVVESLIIRMYEGADEVVCPDGRGGDKGIDILVAQGSRKRVFQLKYFPGGLGQGGRKRQISASFETAMQHQPFEWTLVVPCKLTEGERNWVLGLGADRGVRVRILDGSHLDVHLQNYPEIETSLITRDAHMLEMGQVFNSETALLTNGMQGLQERVSRLGAVSEVIDPDWGFDIAVQNGVSMVAMRPKHPRAHIVNPLSVTLTTNITDPDLAGKVERVIGYGVAEQVVIPSTAITALEFDGPEWFKAQGDHGDYELVLGRTDEATVVGLLVKLEFCAPEGEVFATFTGKVTAGGAGHSGYHLAANFHEVTTLDFLLPRRSTSEGRLSTRMDHRGAHPGDVSRAAGLAVAMDTAHHVRISIDGHSLGMVQFHWDQEERARRVEEMTALRESADDLDAVQRLTQAYFPMPNALTGLERAYLRIAKHLLEGKVAQHPQAMTLDAIFTGYPGPDMDEALRGKPGLIRCTLADFRLELDTGEIPLGEVSIYHPSVVIRGKGDLPTLLRNPPAAGVPVSFDSEDGSNWLMFVESRVPADAPLVPTPWNLTGVTEPPSFFDNQRARETHPAPRSAPGTPNP